jgi:hypothetical protein
VVGAALVLAGCTLPTIDSQTAAQKNVIGGVEIDTTLSGCPFAISGCGAATDDQFLLAYRVPQGTSAPDSFNSTSGPALTFRKSSSYTSEVQRLQPAPAGQEWVGYVSDPFSIAVSPNPTVGTVGPVFGLPRPADGSPFAGPFTYRTIAGGRETNLTDAGTRPVVCAVSDITASISATGGALTECMSSPTLPDLATSLSVPVSDLALIPTGTPSVYPGDTASVPFDAKAVGAAAGGTAYALSVASTLAGSSGSPATPNFTPAPGDNATAANVKVPVNAAPGQYPAVLIAALANGQTRQGSGNFKVLALPAAPIPGLASKTIKVSNGKALVKLRCTGAGLIDPCAGTLSLASAKKITIARKRTVKFGKAKFNIAVGKTKTVKVKLGRKSRAILFAKHSLGIKITFKDVNRAGQVHTVKRSAKLKAGKRA